MIISTLLKTLLLPPAINILCILLGLVLWRSYKWLARVSLCLGFLSLWALSLPVVSAYLHQQLEAPFVLDTQQRQWLSSSTPPEGVEAVVVLGAGRHYRAQEYGGSDTLSHSALWRLRFGGLLAKRWNLPVIVSGGNVFNGDIIPEAALGADFLINELGVDSVWQEGNSRNTWENAQFTKALLDNRGIDRVLLVTHAYHMRRSSFSFAQAGVEFIPVPTGFLGNQAPGAWWRNWLPEAGALLSSYAALHEYLGWYYYHTK